MRTRSKLLLLSIATVALLEAGGYAAGLFAPELFDQVAPALKAAANKPDAQKQFDGFIKNTYSPFTEWTARKRNNSIALDCNKDPHPVSMDEYRVRTYAGYKPERAQVLLAGDSAVMGQDLGDDELVSARIFQQTGIVTANLTGGGFDPVQSFLRLTSESKNYPMLELTVLAIQYDDINKMMNSYRASYLNDAKMFERRPVELMNLKPYMEDGRLITLNLYAFNSWKNFLRLATRTSQNDYWARPAYDFPYSLALIQVLTSHAFIDTQGMNIMKRFNRQYEWQFNDSDISDNLAALLTAYGNWAKRKHITAVVAFIPQNNSDTRSARKWIYDHRAQLPRSLVLKDFGATMPAPATLPDGRKVCHRSYYDVQTMTGRYIDVIDNVFLLRRLLFPKEVLYKPATAVLKPAS